MMQFNKSDTSYEVIVLELLSQIKINCEDK